MGKIAQPNTNIFAGADADPVAAKEPNLETINVDEVELDREVDMALSEPQIEDNGFDKEVSLLPLKQHFGIAIGNTKHNEALNWMMDYAKRNNITGVKGLIAKIREAEFKIGVDTFGQSRVSGIFNYLKLTEAARETIGKIVSMEANASRK